MLYEDDDFRAAAAEESLEAFVEASWERIEPSTPFLNNWHIGAICDHLEAITRGELTRLIVNVPPRYMKPVYDGSMVLLESGRRIPIERVQVGDRVITHEGRGRAVTAVHDQGNLPTLKITTFSGREVIAAHHHPFLTPDGWVEAAKLRVGDALGLVVPRVLASNGETRPAAFRLAGYFITRRAGQGEGINCNVTCFDPEQAADIRACAAELGFQTTEGTDRGRISLVGGARDWVRSIGLAGKNSHTKRVPAFVFEASDARVAEFLGAYFACDGTLQRKGGRATSLTISIPSVNRDLLRDIQHLLLRLGIGSRVRTRNVKHNTFKKGPYRYYCLEISDRDNAAKFVRRVPIRGNKSARLAEWGTVRQEFERPILADPIVSIEPAGERPCRCLTVEGDHSFLAEDLAVHNSTLISICWPVWEWLRRPGERWIFCSYKQDLARDHSIKRRTIIQSDWFQEYWPGRFALTTDQEMKLENDRRGVFQACSVGAGPHGKGGNRLVIDDPHDPDQAESDLERSKGVRFFRTSLYPRLNDKRRGAIVLVMQRLHQADLAGELLEEGDWAHLKLPGRSPTRVLVQTPAGREWFRDDGEPLWPEREDAATLAKVERAMGPIVFAGQYQQEPMPPGGYMFQRDWFPIVSHAPPGRTVRYWDKACLILGTMILTDQGERPIEAIRPGDRVLTRVGYRRVTWAGMTGYRADIIAREFGNGRTLVGTSDHPVWTETRGWVPLAGIRDADSTLNIAEGGESWASARVRSDPPKQRPLPSMGSRTPEGRGSAISRRTVGIGYASGTGPTSSIAPSGVIIGATSRPDMRSIIGTTTRLTIPSTTWNCSPWPSIAVGTPSSGNGTRRRPPRPIAPGSSSDAGLMPRPAIIAVGSAAGRSGLARSVRRLSIAPPVAGNGLALPVYDLTVEGEHEFFANGVLVHNSTQGGGAYTVGVKMRLGVDGSFYVLDVIRQQLSWPARERLIRQTAKLDGTDVEVYVEREPGSSGIESAQSTVLTLPGYVVQIDTVTGDKVVRARPLASYAAVAGSVRLVEGPWNEDYLREVEVFPRGRYKDQVDASSGAFNKLALTEDQGDAAAAEPTSDQPDPAIYSPALLRGALR